MNIPANGNGPSWRVVAGVAWQAAKAWFDVAYGVALLFGMIAAVINACMVILGGPALAPAFEHPLLNALAWIAAIAFAFLAWVRRSIEQAPRQRSLIQQMRELERAPPQA